MFGYSEGGTLAECLTVPADKVVPKPERLTFEPAAAQIAKAFGAHVTGVQSTGALDLVCSIGADRVIDYTKEDFTTGEARYDAVFDNVCNRKLSEVRRVVKPGGTVAIRRFLSHKIAFFVTNPNRADAFRHLEAGHAHGKIVVTLAVRT